MSTFTDWNGPQGGHPSTVSVLQLVEAYQNMLATMKAHIETKVSDGVDVHNVVGYYSNKLNELTAAIDKITNEYVTVKGDGGKTDDVVRASVLAAYATKDDLDEYAKLNDDGDIVVRASALADYATKDDLDKYVAVKKDDDGKVDNVVHASELAEVEKDLEDVNKVLEQIDALSGKLKAVDMLSLESGAAFSAPMRSLEDATNIYLLGKVPDGACTVYVKYVNDTPFSLVANVSVTGEHGAISVLSSKGDKPNNLELILATGTSSGGEAGSYLAIRSDAWVGQNIEFHNKLDFFVQGINFKSCKLFEEGETPNGNLIEIARCRVGNGFNASSFGTGAIEDGDGESLVTVEEKNGKLYLILGNADYDGTLFENRPYLVTEDGRYPFLTFNDLKKTTANVGEVIPWCKFDEDGKPVDYPSVYLPTDGSAVPEQYEELRELIGDTLPLVDFHLIRADKGIELDGLLSDGSVATEAQAYTSVDNLPDDAQEGDYAVVMSENGYVVYRYSGSAWEVAK